MNLGKKTKIVCTIGPVTENEKAINDLIVAGMNVARLNFSHGSFEEHEDRLVMIREASQRLGKSVAILQDLSGPKIRLGEFKDKKVMLEEGQEFVLTTDEIIGDAERAYINYDKLPREVEVGGTIMLQDGTKKLEIVDIQDNNIITKVKIGGMISSHQGVNVPGAKLSISSLTEKDRKDLKFGIKHDLDFIALSFVRSANDVRELRELLVAGRSDAQIIAKIETPEALDNIDEIIDVADGIMVARGDLAIEIPAEEVPLAQKLIIQKCNAYGKPVITATQMLESMVKNPVPTRAEVSDIANAIIDGTDAIMLSEETTLGDFPIEAVKVMTKIACRVEKEVYTRDTIAEYHESHGITDVVSQSAVRAAHSVGAKLIVALTRSGRTAKMIARYRPAERILALSDAEHNVNKMMLTFGCYPMKVPTFKTVGEIMEIVRRVIVENKLVQKDDKVVIVAGMPFGSASETNMILVESL